MTIADEILKNYAQCFKRVKIKRRVVLPSGAAYYEADWLDITNDILSIDNITQNVDDIELNSFTQGGFGLTGKNDSYRLASENFSASHFYGYLTRHRTKVKVEAGYIAEDGTEYAYDIGAGFIIGDEINTQSNGTIYLPVQAPASIFQEVPADFVNDGALPGGDIDWYDTEVVSAVVGYLYNLSVGGNAMFTPYLEGSNITPGNDVVCDLYDFHDWSCLEALTEMAEASNSAHFVGPDFQLYFKSKDATVASQFTFNGPGVRGSDINIYSASDYNEGIRNVYNVFNWYNTDPLLVAQETWTPGDSSSTSKYGTRRYSVDNRLVTTEATRQTILNNLLAAYKDPKEEIVIETKFVPQLKLLDRVTLAYYGDPTTAPPGLWGISLWGTALWTGRRGGIKITKDMKIIRLEHDVMTFKSKLTLREI